ncbi:MULTISPECIES: DUF5410 family protein [unclassified Rickettsia]|uniref:DUF5410 family protein n=1 Tax=unclassified Rickettsia TaxID=114295 RepID=UPI003132F55A
MQNSILIKNEEMVVLTRNIISNIVAGEATKEDLIEFKNVFGTKPKEKERKAFVKALNEILDDDILYKLNHAVMENAHILVPDHDHVFYCRETQDKIFQELLVLEAKRHGMIAKFDVNSKLEPLKPEDIPPAILDHYATLKENFYNKRDAKDSLDSRIAQSINFMMYGPIVRENTNYTKLLNPAAQAILEKEIQKIDGSYIQELSKSRISQYIEKAPRKTVFQINTINKDKTEIKSITDKIIKGIGNELKITPESIIVDSIEKLEEKFLVDNQQKEKILIKLSSCLAKIDNLQLIEEKEKLTSIISRELEDNKTNFSKKINIFSSKYYKIATKKLEDIETEIINYTKQVEVSEEVYKEAAEGVPKVLPDKVIEGLMQRVIRGKTLEEYREQGKKEKVSKELPDSVTGSIEQNLNDSGIVMLGEDDFIYFGSEGA